MKLTESQLRKLIKEMQTGNYTGSGDQIVEYLMFIGLEDEGDLDMVYSALSGAGPVAGLSELETSLRRRLTFDEVNQLIDLFNKDGWFQP